MEEYFTQFLGELSNLKKLIGFYNSEIKLLGRFDYSINNPNNILLQELGSKLLDFSVTKRQFNYNSIIISLYGNFERFIENLVLSYLDQLNFYVKKYDSLPAVLIKNHHRLSLSLLQKIDKENYNGSIDKDEIIKNLNGCITNSTNYTLNLAAFSQHTANFRIGSINDFFSKVDVEQINSKILEHKGFNAFCINKLGKSPGDKISLEEGLSILNELADRRNDVAHGVEGTILQNGILEEYIEFYEKYTHAIFDILQAEIFSFEVKFASSQLGDITDVFRQGKIICLYNRRKNIKIGDLIIGQNNSEIIKTKILGIQINGREVKSITNGLDVEVGLEIDGVFKKSFKVYLCTPIKNEVKGNSLNSINTQNKRKSHNIKRKYTQKRNRNAK